MASHHEKHELTWRIPDEGRTSTFRTRLLRILFVCTIYLGAVWVFGTKAMRLPGLAALVPLAAFLILFAWKTSHARAEGDNIRLSTTGLRWNDSHGGEGELSRDNIKSFRIGLDPDTMRAIPALTLILAGGFESQPVELHEPVTPAQVREYLTAELGLSEDALSDEQFADRLHHSHLVALNASRDKPEQLLLRHSLVEPVKQHSDGWLVGSIQDFGKIYFQPAVCLYRVERANGDQSQLLQFVDVVNYVREHALPTGDTAIEAMVAQIEQEEAQRQQEALMSDVRRAGFYLDVDNHNRWHFEGSQAGLLAFCDRLEKAAAHLKPAPLGARPSVLTMGGPSMGITIQVDHHNWIDDHTICGQPSYLLDLATRIREQLRSASSDTEVFVCTSDESNEAAAFLFHVRADDYDLCERIKT